MKTKTETDHWSFSYHLQKCVISPVLKYNCVIQLNFNKAQLKSFERRANYILHTKTCVISSELVKHASLLV